MGDWSLYLCYKNSSKEKVTLHDGEGVKIKNYIQEHGYNSSLLGIIRILISIILVPSFLFILKKIYRDFKNNKK